MHAGGKRPPQLTLRDHVGAGSERGEGGDDRLVGVGLQRIADGRRQVGDRRGEVAVAVLQGVSVVAVERSADLGGQRIERNPGGMQPTVAVAEVTIAHWVRLNRAWSCCASRYRSSTADPDTEGG